MSVAVELERWLKMKVQRRNGVIVLRVFGMVVMRMGCILLKAFMGES